MKELYLKIKNSVFWEKWGVWVLVIFFSSSFIYEVITIYFAIIRNFLFQEDSQMNSLTFKISAILGVMLSIPGMYYFVFWLGKIHYTFLIKPILINKKRVNVFLYISATYFFYNTVFIKILMRKIFNSTISESIHMSGIVWYLSLTTGIIFYFIENKKNEQNQEIQKQKLEIKALKAQINPHFLFNTLNNLMGTAISENAPKTSLQIQQLAGIMRHVVEETQAEYTPIEKELKFLGDYIELMQLRVPKEENIRINVRIDFDENSFLISPLILITFIENAFKYGISINQACFVDILLTIENKKIELVCKNSIVNVENSTETGLESVKKRLELTYPQKHSLEISKENNVFEVVFKLDLSHENPTV
jgi:hypothetical protein